MKDRKERLLKKLTTSTFAKSLVKALAVLVVFVTTYMLILPAFTLDGQNASKQGGIDVPQLTAVSQTDEAPDGEPAEASKEDSNNESKGQSAEDSSEKIQAGF